MKQNIIIAVLVLIIGFGIGYLIFGKKTVEPVVIVESKIIENTAKIDSLLCVIGERDLDIEKLKDSIRVEIVEVEKLKDSIKNLPITENVDLLKSNLLTFGTHSGNDTLPQLLKINDDTIVAISEGNMIDINFGFSSLKNQLFINRIQLQIINQDSLTIEDQRSIILRKDKLLEKQQIACKQNMEDLQRELRKEKITKTCWKVGGIAVSASLATLLILQFAH